jgi:hypothetical protein
MSRQMRTCAGCKDTMPVLEPGQTTHPACPDRPRWFTPDPERRYLPGQLDGSACVECNTGREYLPDVAVYPVGEVGGHIVFACPDCLWRFTP